MAFRSLNGGDARRNGSLGGPSWQHTCHVISSDQGG
jgi:hypothetical protein